MRLQLGIILQLIDTISTILATKPIESMQSAGCWFGRRVHFVVVLGVSVDINSEHWAMLCDSQHLGVTHILPEQSKGLTSH